jgi:hypothetical protein
MKITSDDQNQPVSGIRSIMSRQRLRELGQFAETLSTLNLTQAERDVKRAERMLHAARLCINRGHLRDAQKLLTRSYSTASRLERSALAADIAGTRVGLENIMRNADAMRLWMTRQRSWEAKCRLDEEQRDEHREQFYSTVICTPVDRMNSHYDEYVCDDLRHIIPLYDYCSLGLFNNVLQMLDTSVYSVSQSAYLRDEVRWLRFRLHCSMQHYEIAASLLEEMQNNKPCTQRLREYVTLGSAYISLQRQLYHADDTSGLVQPRVSTFLNTFSVVSYELAGLHLSVFVYELIRLIMEHNYAMADKRLAALRSRVYRQRAHGNLEELHIFLRVVGYILGTSHRCKRAMPHHLLAEFHQRMIVVPYAQQGMLAYSELAFRLLRYLGYR